MEKPREPILVIVSPCYNEEEALPETEKCLSEKLTQLISQGLISPKSGLLFVDDGSSDNTWNLIEKYRKENPLVFKGIKLTENMGQQKALFYGLLSVKDYADVIISIDADLQDDVEAIDKMLKSYSLGYEIVLGVRSGREADGFFKKANAWLFYRLMRFLGANLVDNHADFRLLGKNALNAMVEFTKDNEANVFLRGIVPLLGYQTDIVYYKREKRLAGKSKYTLRKMFGLAFDGLRLYYSRRGR